MTIYNNDSTTFVINDITLSVAPTKINIRRVALNNEWKALRTRSSIKAKSGHSNLTITLEAVFVGLDEINQKLRPLLAQFRLTPFCYVENQHLRNTVMGKDSDGMNMAMALQGITASSVPDSPETIIVEMTFLWFNYKPYTPNFYFKDNPFLAQPQYKPGKAFELFYRPQLEDHPPVRSILNQTLTFTYPEFSLDQDVQNQKKVSDFKLADVLDDSSRQDLNSLFGEYENTINYIRTANRTQSTQDGSDSDPFKVDRLESALAKWQVIQSGPAAASSSASELKELTDIIADITSQYQNAAQKQIDSAHALRQLLRLKDDILRKGDEIVTKPGGWLPFFKDPIKESGRKVLNSSHVSPVVQQLYYRIRQVDLNQGLGSNLTVTDMSAGFYNQLVPLPVLSYQYPTCQYLGSSDIRGTIAIKVTSDEALQTLTDMYNSIGASSLNGKFIPAQYKNMAVRNPLLNLLGAKEMIFEDMIVQTVPGSPGTYDVQLVLSDAGIKPGDIEKLQVERVSDNRVRHAIWKAILQNIIVTQTSIEIADARTPIDLGSNSVRRGTKNVAVFDFLADAYLDEQDEDFINSLLDKTLTSTGVFIDGQDNLKLQLNQIISATDQGELGLGGRSIISSPLLTALSVTEDEVMGADALSELIYSAVKEKRGNDVVIASFGNTDNFQEVRDVIINEGRSETQLDTTSRQNLQQALDMVRQIKLARLGGLDPLSPTGIYTDPATGQQTNFHALLTPDIVAAFAKDKAKFENDRISKLLLINNSNAVDTDGDGTPRVKQELLDQIEREASMSAYETAFRLVENSVLATSVNGTERQIVVGDLFKRWNKFAIAVADTIINADYISMPMFLEARLLKEQNGLGVQRGGYIDFNLEEIESLVRMNYSTTDIPQNYVLEPDFYFFNETIDAGLGNLIPTEQIEEIRTFSKGFALNTIQHATSYYQTEYLKNVDDKFGEFIKESISNTSNGGKGGQICSPDFSLAKKVGPASTVSKKVTDAYFSSNQLDMNSAKLSIKGKTKPYLVDFDPENPEHGKSDPINKLYYSTDVNEYVSGNTTFASFTPEEIAAFGGWVNPLPGGRAGSPPGMRDHPILKDTKGRPVNRMHSGTDMTLPVGSSFGAPVVAAANGRVTTVAANAGGAGNMVVITSTIQSRTYVHKYFHLDQFEPGLRVGQDIAAGQQIGTCGTTGHSTGPHLHFELHIDGRPVFPFTDTPTVATDVPTVPLISLNNNTVLASGPVASHRVGESILDRTLASMVGMYSRNSCYRMNRAYPTFHLAFIEDDSDEVVFKFDDFFSYNSAISFRVIRDREVPADLAEITLTNISGLLSNRKWRGTYNEKDPKGPDGQVAKENPDDKLKIGTADENPISSMLLQEGVKVELRLGYTNQIDKMDIVMIGKITEVEFKETDDLVQIIVQSLAVELVQDIKAVDKPEVADGWFFNDARTANLLNTMISQPECVSFGKWKRGNPITNTNRNLLTDKWEWNPTPQTDNIFAPDSSALDTSWFNVFSSMSYHVYRTTIWDVFKEMELRHPDYISSPVPYVEMDGQRTRMTMFFGLPDQLYFASDPSSKTNRKLAELEQTREDLKDAIENNPEKITGIFEQLTDPSVPLDKEWVTTKKLVTIGSKAETLEGKKLGKAIDLQMQQYIDRAQKRISIDEGSIQPFRKYHILTGRQHIISNNISASASNGFNAVTIQYKAGTFNFLRAIGSFATAGFVDSNATINKINITPDGLELQEPEVFTMKLDARIPDEEVRENFVTYPNCQGDEMAKRYAVSLLTQGCKYIYKGELVILGNPGIKPYDICYVFDEYNDMVGPIEVRRVIHEFSYEYGFVTIITPDLVAHAAEGTTFTGNQALGLMAEAIIKNEMGLDLNVIDPNANPALAAHSGASITSNLLYGLSVGVGGLIGFFGGKKLIYLNQFGNPVRLSPLLHHGVPLVAGIAPDKLKTIFSINSLGQWVREGIKGLSEGADEFFDRLNNTNNNSLLFNPRGVVNGGPRLGAFRNP